MGLLSLTRDATALIVDSDLVCIIALFFMAGSSRNIQKTSLCSNKNKQKELNNIA